METEELYKLYKPLLFSIAYRMLGSVMDAEDIVQDAFLAMNENDNPSDIQHVKAYLCKIVSFKCIDRIRNSAKHREVYVGPWLPEPLVEPVDEPSNAYLNKESLSTAYLLLLQQLSEVERIVFLLREAFHFEYDELAAIVGKSEANCRQIFHRARRSLTYDPSKTVTAIESARSLVEQFVSALHQGDINRLLELLTAGAVIVTDGGGKVRSALQPIRTAENVIRFLLGVLAKATAAFTVKLTTVNGMPGVVILTDNIVTSVTSFHIEEDKIQYIYQVNNPDKLAHLNNVAFLQGRGV